MAPVRPAAPPRLVFRDARRTAVLIATGPSAGDADFGLCRGWPVIVVNDAYRLAPWADVLYACDPQWWRVHHTEVARMFHGERWTQCDTTAQQFGLKRYPGKHAAGLSLDPAWIHFNQNSGAQALNLAYHWGARRIVLVGYDMGAVNGQQHFFGDHPPPLARRTPYDALLRHYAAIAVDCRRLGIEVINTSPVSRLQCFARASLADALRTTDAE